MYRGGITLLNGEVTKAVTIVEESVRQVHGEESMEFKLIESFIKTVGNSIEENKQLKDENKYLYHYGSKTDWNGDIKYTNLSDLMRNIPRSNCKAYYIVTKWGRKQLVTNASSAQIYMEQNGYIAKNKVTKFYEITSKGLPYIHSITKKGNTITLTPIGVKYFTDLFGHYPRTKSRNLFSAVKSILNK